MEQKHLQELYQINEVANTLSVLLQAQSEQKEKFKLVALVGFSAAFGSVAALGIAHVVMKYGFNWRYAF